MKSGAQPFMASLIDYAGLFPPASLPLDSAIRNYAAYQVSEEAWMLGRFIIPASRLPELDAYVSLFIPERPLLCAVIGSKSKDKEEGLLTFRADLESMLSFCERHGPTVKVDVLEFPLPPLLPDQDLLETIGAETAKRGIQAFCEMTLPLNEDWERHILQTLDAMAEHNASHPSVLGFKLRTGGVTADAFPTPKQVSAALIGCRDRGIPMKFTAGLHHPIRMYREEVETQMHGFVNVFAAGMLAHTHPLTALETERILADEEPSHFSFDSAGLSWKELMITVSEIEKLRTTLLRSYGSCSFDEPREDLRALQIL